MTHIPSSLASVSLLDYQVPSLFFSASGAVRVKTSLGHAGATPPAPGGERRGGGGVISNDFSIVTHAAAAPYRCTTQVHLTVSEIDYIQCP